MEERTADRLKLARIAAGYKTATEFAAKNEVPQSTYALHESGGRGLTRDVAVKYAKLLHIGVDWLLTGAKGSMLNGGSEPRNEIRLERIFVVGEVQAGQWREAVQWPQEEWVALLAPIDPRYAALTKYGLKVVGPSMDQIYPQGTIVICVNVVELGRNPRSGERVHVQCRNHQGLIEATIKEYLERGDGSRWLMPRSTDPAYQAPIRIDAGADRARMEDCQVVGLVIGSYRAE